MSITLTDFSSSLAWDIQLNGLRKVPGLENVKMYRPGYAIEYDYFAPTQLLHTLETKLIDNLYFAGPNKWNYRLRGGGSTRNDGRYKCQLESSKS